MEKVRGLGARGHYQLSHSIERDEEAVIAMYKSKLAPFGVGGVDLDCKVVKDGSHVKVLVSMTLVFNDGKTKEGKLERYVDTSSFDVSRTFLKAYCGASEEEAESFMAELDMSNLQDMDAELYEHFCLNYAYTSMANNNGGEWTEQDSTEIKEVFGFAVEDDDNLSGKVLWWDDRDQNGVILGDDGRKYYFDISVLEDPVLKSGSRKPKPNDTALFQENKEIPHALCAHKVLLGV